MSTPPVPSAGRPARVPAPPVPYGAYFWAIVSLWSLAVAVSLLWNLSRHRTEVLELARQTARALTDKDLVYREWNAKHGGVFVDVDAETPPNPHLVAPGRDVTTLSGRAMTLVNPAYMARQVFELQNRKQGVLGRTTSLKPIREENAPDPWERRALEALEDGRAAEVSAVESLEGQPYLRLIRPMWVEASCLDCHAHQGYREGDVRGGISVAVPMREFGAGGYREQLALAHGGLWLLGILGHAAGWRRLMHHVRARQRAEVERENLLGELQEALVRIRTLDGLVPICAGCKKIRDDQGFWQQLERYVEEHSHATFSHGYCPDCLERLYEELKTLRPASAADPGSKPAPETCRVESGRP